MLTESLLNVLIILLSKYLLRAQCLLSLETSTGGQGEG